MSELDRPDVASESEDITTQVLEHETDVIPFLSHYNITPGATPVNKRLIYKLYKQFYSKDPVNSLQFHRTVGLFITSYWNKSGGFYKLNQDNFTISAHMFKEHNKHRIEKTKSNTFRRHFESFLAKKEIRTGSKWFEGYFLHEVYKDYCREIKLTRPKLGRDNFHKFMKLYFKHRRISDSRAIWYMVNEETLNLLTKEEKDGFKERRSKKERE